MPRLARGGGRNNADTVLGSRANGLVDLDCDEGPSSHRIFSTTEFPSCCILSLASTGDTRGDRFQYFYVSHFTVSSISFPFTARVDVSHRAVLAVRNFLSNPNPRAG